jgi:hypothetical protein
MLGTSNRFKTIANLSLACFWCIIQKVIDQFNIALFVILSTDPKVSQTSLIFVCLLRQKPPPPSLSQGLSHFHESNFNSQCPIHTKYSHARLENASVSLPLLRGGLFRITFIAELREKALPQTVSWLAGYLWRRTKGKARAPSRWGPGLIERPAGTALTTPRIFALWPPHAVGVNIEGRVLA